MAKVALTFDAVRDIGLTLPDVVEGTMYGAPALKVHGNLLTCVPANRSAEPNCAVVRIDRDLRAALLKEAPDIYYITEHYANHPTVLVRLSRIGPRKLRQLLSLAWNFASSADTPRSRGAKGSGARRG